MGTVTADADLLQNGYAVSGLIGTRQDQFYLQLSGAATDRDSWSLLNGSRWPRAYAEWRNPDAVRRPDPGRSCLRRVAVRRRVRTNRKSTTYSLALAQRENPSQISAE